MGHLHGRDREASLTSPALHKADDPAAEARGAVVLRAGLWLVFLAPFFYLSYGFSNWLASQRADVGSVVFAFERYIPFIDWTIVPYWSINLFYALSLLLNETRRGVDRLALRYLTVQVVAVSFFIALPLKATFVRPDTDGLPGFLFAVLGGFDRPFNQAPSLHIALLVIIWDHWRHRLGGAWRAVWHGWCVLIGLSVLTTWQHHFIDIPTGALLGFLALWLIPREGVSPVLTGSDAAIVSGIEALGVARRRSLRLAMRYGLAALGLAAAAGLAAPGAPVALCLLWPALSLAIVALAYATFRVAPFQKSGNGSVSLASRVLLLPYRVGARVNVWAWTRHLPASAAVADGVSLGRYPTAGEASRFSTVIDLAAEMVRPAGATSEWVSLPMLDLVPPLPAALEEAGRAIERSRASGPVLVCCALGFQRSATVAAHWLVATGRAADLQRAGAIIAATGRPVHLAIPSLAGVPRS